MNIDLIAREKLLQKTRHEKILSALQKVNQPQAPTPDLKTPLEKVGKSNNNNFVLNAISTSINRKLYALVAGIFKDMPTKENIQELNINLKEIIGILKNIEKQPEKSKGK
jgi:hypothetical protein